MVDPNHSFTCDVKLATSKVQQRLSACQALETRGLLLDLHDPLRHFLGSRYHGSVRYRQLQHMVPRLELVRCLTMDHDNNYAHLERWPFLLGA